MIISDDLFFLYTYTCRCLFVVGYFSYAWLLSVSFACRWWKPDTDCHCIQQIKGKSALVYAVMRKFLFISCIFKKGITNFLAAESRWIKDLEMRGRNISIFSANQKRNKEASNFGRSFIQHERKKKLLVVSADIVYICMYGIFFSM